MPSFLFYLRRSRHRHHFRLLHDRRSSTAGTSPLRIPLTHPTYLVWSANTSLGKTLVSTGLAFSSLLDRSVPAKFLYLKPVQTGFPVDSDSLFLFNKLYSLSLVHRPRLPLHSSHYVLQSSLSASNSFYNSLPGTSLDASSPLRLPGCASGMVKLNSYEEKRVLDKVGGSSRVSELISKTIFAYNEAVSPHLAAEREGGVVEDSMVVEMVGSCLREGLEAESEEREVMCVVETAGGVASPSPSGTLQCDLYRPLRLPAILVGDGRLGGISATISAYESLILRGYDVAAVVFEDHGLVNEVPIMSYLRKRVPVLVLPQIPQDPSNDLIEWFEDSQGVFNSLRNIMHSSYEEKMQKLLHMRKKAKDKFWWPFTQHGLVPEECVTVIDSRCGESFAVFKDTKDRSITQMFDACASWWTQGPDATLQTELARDMGYAAARYGHVMFPENVHEPALECAELLLDGVGKGWASRVYFSENGSTAIEIALKMAFRRFAVDHGILSDTLMGVKDDKQTELIVLALQGSYHGDTLGAMEAQSPSAYTSFLQQPWYTGRGLFLDPPTVFLSKSIWTLEVPEPLHPKILESELIFSSREEMFSKSRDESELTQLYSSYILQHLPGIGGPKYIGALIIEPVIQGAGGMRMVDPLFHRVLVKECRNRRIPVIFDEVFTGFWRLGAECGAELLGVEPDIACYAKLLTGGIIPLAATLASAEIFDAFMGESKLNALLHGHSYTAHAMGCTAAVKSIKWFKHPEINSNINAEVKLLNELWDIKLVNQLSNHPAVQRVIALGTLFAMELQVDGNNNNGYGSLFSKALLQMLRDDGIYVRPLGNVVYLMCGPCTSPEICSRLLTKLYHNLDEFHGLQSKDEIMGVVG
ncbi:hypothetical protein SAY87_022953 [Trapa incisa]|uniref:Uncharacterized protein n=1 Tax=Trapa incisa TaxID=236973 RepID=A0AAN7K561_9MYRT|nr:hypothetical protein SAY87_022953 [Trapa incisa]